MPVLQFIILWYVSFHVSPSCNIIYLNDSFDTAQIFNFYHLNLLTYFFPILINCHFYIKWFLRSLISFLYFFVFNFVYLLTSMWFFDYIFFIFTINPKTRVRNSGLHGFWRFSIVWYSKNTKEHKVSETGSFSIFRRWVGDVYSVGSVKMR